MGSFRTAILSILGPASTTQNVDELHEAAGSRNVLHLHGQISHVRCIGCGSRTGLARGLLRTLPPSCRSCRAALRPDVVWFGEALPEATLKEATDAAAHCDAALVIGTSNLVYPAAGLPRLAKSGGAGLVEVNPERTDLTDDADVFLQGTAGDLLPRLHRAVAAHRNAAKLPGR